VKTLPYESLGRYQVEAEVGRGAMGIVYRARDPKIDRWVAIKTISLSRLQTEQQQQYRERFLEEARAAGKLSHPGIVTVFDVGEHPATSEPYLVMEYITGAPLSVLVARGRRLPLSLALQFTMEIAEALGYAHSQGVIHRDIKPENILITEDGHAKVSDFGVARLKQAVAAEEGQIFGTLAYMSPEQLVGGLGDGRSDLFSLGVVMYSMITGFRPFQGNTTETVCFKVVNAEPVPVTSFEAELPPELDRIVERAMAKDPRDRYRTGAEMADAIRSFVRDEIEAAEDTSFLPDVFCQDGTAPGQVPPSRAGTKPGLRFPWQAALSALLVACTMTAWHLNKEYRQSAKIRPPVIPLPSAPRVEKALQPAPRVKKALQPSPRVKKALQPGALPYRKQDAASAKMRLEILHHFNSGKASVWLDRQLLFEQELRAGTRHPSIFRALEIDQVASLQFAAGKHRIEIRVVAPENAYDQSQHVDLDFGAGQEHLLLVNCDKRKMQVSLQ
jgi:eukaryotic-like serine/threonine-protein kinase